MIWALRLQSSRMPFFQVEAAGNNGKNFGSGR
jgi:hypothetical protein